MIDLIIGLGNPAPSLAMTRHNIGFRIADALAKKYKVEFNRKNNYLYTSTVISEFPVSIIKPMTGMNQSGAIIPHLNMLGYKLRSLLVIHDELEKPFGTLQIRLGGSHRGHNGLRSIMNYGAEFWRLRFGIDRPSKKEDVAEYVVMPFTVSEEEKIPELMTEAITMIETAVMSANDK